MQSFIRDPDVLEKGLFKLHTARQGVQTLLNINYLPDLLQHVKKELTSDEVIRLEEYHLQNYLVELSISYTSEPSLQALKNHVLRHIRGNNNFWYRHNNQQVINEEQEQKHKAINTYHQDIKLLKETFKEDDKLMEVFEIQYPERTSNKFRFIGLHQVEEPHFGTRCCINHIAYIPKFVIQKENKENCSEDSVIVDQKEQRKLLQQCILFLLSNKKNVHETVKVQQRAASASSDKAQDEENDLEDEVKVNQQICEEVIKKTLKEEFIEYIEHIPSVPAFYNSIHMQVLTKNIINICSKVLKLGNETERMEKQPIIKGHEASDSFQMLKLDEISMEVLSKISDKDFDESQIQLLASSFLRQWHTKLKQIRQDIQNVRKDKNRGWISSPEEVSAIKNSYMQMLNRPDFVELTQYRASGSAIPWKDDDYLKFLKGLAQYFNVPTNNKKIASYMGSKIEPNHVKHVKGIYLTVMKDRMDRGQCGGGKRGKCLSKADFLERDISGFSMKWFEKGKKIRKRKQRRRRRLSQSDMDDEVDSDF